MYILYAWSQKLYYCYYYLMLATKNNGSSSSSSSSSKNRMTKWLSHRLFSIKTQIQFRIFFNCQFKCVEIKISICKKNREQFIVTKCSARAFGASNIFLVKITCWHSKTKRVVFHSVIVFHLNRTEYIYTVYSVS